MKETSAKMTFRIIFISFLAFILIGCGGESGSPGGSSGLGITASIALSSGDASLLADGGSSTTISAVLSDSTNQPVFEFTSVVFKTNLGTFRNGLQKYSVKTTDNSGGISVTLISGTIPGTAEVWAESNNVTQKVEINFLDPHTKVDVFASPNTLNPGSEATVTAKITDAYDNPVMGEPVNFSLTINNSGATLEALSAVTDLSGEAIITYTAGATDSVTDTISATTTTGTPISNTTTVNIDSAAVMVGRITIESGADSLPADGISSTGVTVTVYDIAGVPMPAGTVILFKTNLGSFSASDNTLKMISRNIIDDSGTIIVSLISDTQEGIATIVANASGITQSLSISFAGGGDIDAAEMLMDVSQRVIDATGSSRSEVKVLLRDDNHNPIAGAAVNFSTNLGTVTGMAITGTDGYAYVDGIYPALISAQQNGIATVKAWYGPKNLPYASAQTDVAFSGVTITMTADPDSLSTSEETIVESTLRGPAGNFLVDQEIFLYTDLGKFSPINGGTVTNDQKFTAYTDTSGKISVKLTSTSGGPATVTGFHAPTENAPGETSDAKTVIFSGNTLTISPAEEYLVADGSDLMNINLKLEDESGDPVANQMISLATTLGNIENPVTTDPLGEAVAILQAGTVIGDANLTAVVEFNGVEITVRKVVPFISGVVNSLELITDPSIIKVNTGISEVRAIVKDAQGNPIHNVNVAFTIIKAPGGGETITPAIAKTGGADSNLPGQVIANFTAGSLGSDAFDDVIIEASVGSIVASASLTITSEASNISLGACTTITCITDNGDGSYSIPISAVISDVNGIAVPAGVEVTFAVANADLGIILSPVSTSDSGRATTILTFPATQAGNDITIIASTGGISQSVVLELPSLDTGAISNIFLSGPNSILGDGVSTIELRAQAVDNSGDWMLASVFFDNNMVIEFTGADAGNFMDYNYWGMGETRTDFIAYPSADENNDPSDGFTSQDHDAYLKAYSGNTVESNIAKVKVKGITLTVFPEKTTLLANGTSVTTITAVLKETTTGLPVADADLSFGVTNGFIAGTAKTDDSGTALINDDLPEFTSVKSDVDIVASIRCYYGSDIMASTELNLVTSSDVGSLIASVDKNSIPNDPSETATITVQVLDDNGNPAVNGQRVTFQIVSGPGQVDASNITEDGITTATFRATPTTGTSRIRVASGDQEVFIEIDVVEDAFVVGAINLSVATTAIPADGVTSVAINAGVLDSTGEPMSNVTVQLVTDRGKFSVDGAKEISRTTDTSGNINFSLIAGDDTDSGTATIIATAGNITQKIEIAIVGSGDISLTASPSTLFADGDSESSLAVTILTNDGKPISDNTRVNFTIVSGEGHLEGGYYYHWHDRESWSYSSGGSASVIYNAPEASEVASFPHTVTIQASIPDSNYDPVTAEIIVNKSVGGIEVFASKIQLPADGSSSSNIIAIVTDSRGRPVEDGSRINFSVVSGSGGFPYSSTDWAYTTGGSASDEFSVSDTPGPVTIRVSSEDNLTSATIVLDVVDEVSQLKVSINPQEMTADGSSEGTITAQLVDIDGRPVVDGMRVNFNIISGNGYLSYSDKSDWDYTSGGSATVRYYAPEANVVSSFPETVTIQVSVPESDLSSVTASFILVKSVGNIELFATPSILLADGQSESQILAIVTDSNGSPAQDGTRITYSILSGSGGLPYSGSTQTTTTGGNASAFFRVSDNTGPVTVRVASEDNTTSSTIVIEVVSEVGEINLAASLFEIYASGSDMSTITASLLDPLGSPVTDSTKVYFSITAGAGYFNYKGNSTETEYTAAGVVSTNFYSITPGTTTIDVTDESGTVRETINILVKETGIGSIALAATPDTMPADGGSSAVITATMKDTRGQAVPPNTEVEFTTTHGTFSNGTQTLTLSTADSTGIILTSLVASTTGGVAEVQASSGGISQLLNIIIYDSTTDVGQINLTAVPTTLPADGISSAAITAVVRDSSGNSVPSGTSVVFTTDLGTFSNGLTSISYNIGNNTGVVTTSLIAPTVASGQATIEVTSGGVTQAITVSITGSEASILGDIALTSSLASIPADGLSSTGITATLRDTTGAAMPAGTSVTFTTNLGRFSNGLQTMTLQNVGTNGTISTSLIAGSTEGVAEVRASSGGITQLLNIIIYASTTDIGQISLTSSAAELPNDGTSSVAITAVLRDSSGNLVPSGTAVTFTTSSGTFPNGLTSISFETIDDTGTVITSLIAPTTSGSAIIEAASGGVIQTITLLITEVSIVANITLVSSLAELPADGSSSSAITSTVTDISGDPMPVGTSITFTTTLGTFPGGVDPDGAGPLSSRLILNTGNDSGQIFISLIAPLTITGEATITASSGGVTQTASVTITSIVIPVADKFSISTNLTSVQTDGADFAIVTALVLDASSAPIVGTTVNFSSTGGQISAGSVVTDANGEAGVIVSSGPDKTNGPITITATVDALTANIPIVLYGTVISLAPASATLSTSLVAPFDEIEIIVNAEDAGGNPIFNAPIAITYNDGGTGAPLSIGSPTTDYAGEISLVLTVNATTTDGLAQITFSGLGIPAAANLADYQGNYTIGAPTDIFQITEVGGFSVDDENYPGYPGPYSAAFDFGTVAVTCHAGGLVEDDVVVFATTVGIWEETGTQTWEYTLTAADVAGTLNITGLLTSAQSGLATVQVYYQTDPTIVDLTYISFYTPASQAYDIKLDATQTNIQPSVGGSEYSLGIYASVYDQFNGPVLGATVDFYLTNTTGGGEFLTVVSATTNSVGIAQTAFVSGTLSTGSDPSSAVLVTARVNTPAVCTDEETTISCALHSPGNDLDGDYFNLYQDNGGVLDTYYVWYNDGGSVDPAIAGETGIEVALTALPAGNTAIQVANRTATAIDDVLWFSATSPGTSVDVLTCGDVNGVGDGATDGGALIALGFTFSTATQGTGSGPEFRSDTVPITISGAVANVSIGMSISATSSTDDTIYYLPVSVLVADTNGNPVIGTSISLSLRSTQYSTGYWVELVGGGYGVIFDNPCDGEDIPGTLPYTFVNEDINNNSILDNNEDTTSRYTTGTVQLPSLPRYFIPDPVGSPGVVGYGFGTSVPGLNNGVLDPGQSAAGTIPPSVETDEFGVANFVLTYQKQYAVWLEAQITANAMVFGTEYTSSSRFWLPHLESEEEDIATRFRYSPFWDLPCAQADGP